MKPDGMREPMAIALGGWLAGAVEGLGVGLLIGGVNPYVAFSVVLGGAILWTVLRAGIAPRETRRGASAMTPEPATLRVDWVLYTCTICDSRTFYGASDGGNLNCSCSAKAEDVTWTRLYAGDTGTMAEFESAVRPYEEA